MGVLADLVRPSTEGAIYDDGVDGFATEGASWRWEFFEVVDKTGTLIDLTGVTGTCKILTPDLATSIVTVTFIGAADGSFTLTVDESLTAGLAAGSVTGPRVCRWYLKLSDGTDVVQVWEPFSSSFSIYAAGV